MLSYELCLLMRIMPKSQLKTALKRVGSSIFEKGGIIRKVEHFGTRDLPFKMSANNLVHRKASYFMFEMTIPPAKLDDFLEETVRDVDIIRRSLYRVKVPEEQPCTLEEELQPPPYRKNVQDLIAEARRLDKPKFDHNTGLDYYPFQK